MGGTDGLVGILGIALGLEHMVLAVIVGASIAMTNEIRRRIHGLIGKPQRVGTHIGDQTQSTLTCHIHTFIQLLGDGHGPLGGHIQLPGSLLLQGRGGKRRRSGALFLTLFHIGDGKFLTIDVTDDSIYLIFILQLDLLLAAMIMGNERTGLANAIQCHIQRPVFPALECTDLIFPIHHQSGCHTLHPSGRKTTADLLPQKGGKLITHDPVQDAASLLRIHQVSVDLTGVGNGFLDHLLGDLIKCHTPGLVFTQTHQFLQMPGNSLTLTVRVSCQVDSVCLGSGILQFPDQVLFTLNRNVMRIKAVQVHAHGALGQVTQVAHTGLDHIIRPQIFTNGLCLGG